MRRTRAGLALTIALLLGYECLRTFVLPGPAHLVANLAAAAGIYGVARWAGIPDPELGLTRWGSGLRLGLLAFAVVSIAIALAAVLPATHEIFDRASGPDGSRAVLYEVIIVIPLGTVVLEELAFRGSLLALLHRQTSSMTAAVVSSLLFASWHVIPSVWSPTSDTEAALASTGWSSLPLILVATFLAGLAFCWLRRRSGSLLAPYLAHVATNSTATLAVWLVAT